MSVFRQIRLVISLPMLDVIKAVYFFALEQCEEEYRDRFANPFPAATRGNGSRKIVLDH